MSVTNAEIFTLWTEKGKNFKDVATELVERYGENVVGTARQVYDKVKRRIESRPKKPVGSDIYKQWEKELCFNTNEHGGIREGAGRHKSTLSDHPKSRTTKNILQPKIEELLIFANEQGVGLEEVIESISQNYSKKAQRVEIEIPKDAATAFFFYEYHSQRSWTELRLFLKTYGVILPTRNTIDEEKKKLMPPITVQEIKSSVDYEILVENTVKGNYHPNSFNCRKSYFLSCNNHLLL